MEIYYTSHFQAVIALARTCDATSVSVQDHYVFCNFDTVAKAERFISIADVKHAWRGVGSSLEINRERPGTVAEIAVHHPR